MDGLKTTAFVSHFECARHDTGWGHPDHQGRLPAITRAVYADMLVLFDRLLNVEGRLATDEELHLVHAASYLERVRRLAEVAEANGRPMEVAPGLMVSGATWTASRAAIGCALEAVDAIADGRSRNAFCAVRPPARDAVRDAPGRFGFLNAPMAAVRYLEANRHAERVLVVEWGESASGASMLEGTSVRVIGLGELPADADNELFLDRLRAALDAAVEGFSPDYVVLSSGFDWLAGDPVGGRAVDPAAFFQATVAVRELADDRCGGRLVSILEGGYEPVGTAAAVLQHLRAMAFLPPAS